MSRSTDATRTARHEPLRIRRPRRLTMRIEGPARDGERVVLERRSLLVGRRNGADIVLDHESVSAQHLEIRPGRHTVIRDLGSKNGTWIGERQIFHGTLLPGDVIRVGDCRLRFEGIDDLDVELLADDQFGEMYGSSLVMRELFADLARLAKTELTIMLFGETGTGKELAARAIHEHSARRNERLVVLDCGNLTRTLAESALFGHRRGAFTGADRDHTGYFEQAHRGTIFLDEIGELPLDLQPKLLRVLDRGELCRVGESVQRSIDVRVIAATHRDLLQLVDDGGFRSDLYFRLNQSAVELPALRERGEDIEVLALRFLNAIGASRGLAFQSDALQALRRHSWPGNVRQLRNVVERASGIVRDPTISAQDLKLYSCTGQSAAIERALARGDYEGVHDEIDKWLLLDALEQCGGNLTTTSEKLSIRRERLRRRLKHLGLYKGK